MNNQQSEEFLSNHQSEEDDSFYSIPQIEGFYFVKTYKTRNYYINQQSEEA